MPGKIELNDFFDFANKDSIEAFKAASEELKKSYGDAIKDLAANYKTATKAQQELTKALLEQQKAAKQAEVNNTEGATALTKISQEVIKQSAEYKKLQTQVNNLSLEKGILADKLKSLNTITEKANKVTNESSQANLTLKQRVAEARKEFEKYANDVNSPQFVKARDTFASLQAQQNKVTQEAKLAVKEAQAQKGSYRELEVQIERLSNQAKNMADAFGENSPELARLNKEIDEQKNKLKEFDAAQGNFQRNVGNYPSAFSGAFAILKTEFDSVRAKLNELKKDEVGNAEAVKKLTQEYALLDKLVGSQEAGFVSMKSEIKNNQLAIEQLTKAYGAESDVVQHLIKTNAELRDQQADLIATQKTLGSDTFVFDGLIQSAQGLASVYGLAQGAASLFGAESEEVQKQLVKLQAVMTIITSLQSILNIVQKESAATQLVMSLREKALAAAMVIKNFVMTGSTSATVANTTATVAQGVATTSATVATRAATAAAIGLRGALVASGIGVIILLIANLASGMNYFGESTKEATDRQKEFNEAVANSRKTIDDFATDLNQIRTDGYLRRLKASEASISTVFNAEREALTKSFELRKKGYDNQIKLIDSEIADLEEADKTKDGLSKEDQKRLDDLRDKRFEVGIQSTLAEEKFYEERKTMEAEFQAEIRKEAEKARKKRLDDAKKLKDAQEKEAKDQYERAKQLDDAFDALRKYRLEQEIENQNEISDNVEENTFRRNEALFIAADKARQIAEIERDAALRNDNITFDQRTLILEQFRNKVAEINKQLKIKLLPDFDIEKAEAELNLFTLRRNVILEKGLLDGNIKEEEYSNKSRKIEEDRLRERINILQKGGAKQEEILRAEYDLYKYLNEGKTESDRRVAEVRGQLQSSLSTLEDSLFQRGQEQKQQELTDTQNQRQKELELAGDNAKEKDIINKEYDKRERKIKRDIAIADREKAIFDIGISIATNLAKYAGNVPLEIEVAAIGALELAAVLAKPLPKFARGTQNAPEGLAIVDEEGPELRISGGSAYLGSNKGPRLTYLNRGDKIKTAVETRRILENNFSDNVLNSYQQGYKNLSEIKLGPVIDYDELGKRVAEPIVNAIKNKPSASISIDKNGFKTTLRQGNMETQYLTGKHNINI